MLNKKHILLFLLILSIKSQIFSNVTLELENFIDNKIILKNNQDKFLELLFVGMRSTNLNVRKESFSLCRRFIINYKNQLSFPPYFFKDILNCIDEDSNFNNSDISFFISDLLKEIIRLDHNLDEITLLVEKFYKTKIARNIERALDLYRYLVCHHTAYYLALNAAKEKVFDSHDFIRGSALHLFEVLAKQGIGFQDGLNAACKNFFIKNGWHYRNRALDLFKALFTKGIGLDDALSLIEVGVDYFDSFRAFRTVELFEALVSFYKDKLILSRQYFNRVLNIIAHGMSCDSYKRKRRYFNLFMKFFQTRKKAFDIPRDMIDGAILVAQDLLLNNKDQGYKSSITKSLKQLLKKK